MTEYRNEWKYICTEVDLELIRRRLGVLMKLDQNQRGRECYHIRSLYFDDAADNCFHANEEGLDYRKKFRLRIYNRSDEKIALEIKYKIHGFTKKESCSLSRKQCRILMDGGMPACYTDSPRPLKQLCLAIKTARMHPVAIVEYERTAFTAPAGNVRVTLDRNIAGSRYTARFLDETVPLLPVMEQGKHILEVKYDEVLPSYIAAALNMGRLEQTTFSKYCTCRLRLKNM